MKLPGFVSRAMNFREAAAVQLPITVDLEVPDADEAAARVPVPG